MYTVHRKERRELEAEEKTEKEKAETAVTEKDGGEKESSGHVNRSFQNDPTDLCSGVVTTGDVFLRASWREKTHNNNNRLNGGAKRSHAVPNSTNNED